MLRAYNIRVTPALPNSGICFTIIVVGKPRQLVSGVCMSRLDDAVVFEPIPQVAVIPCRVDVVLCVVECASNLLSRLSCRVTDGLGDGVGCIGGAGVHS